MAFDLRSQLANSLLGQTFTNWGSQPHQLDAMGSAAGGDPMAFGQTGTPPLAAMGQPSAMAQPPAPPATPGTSMLGTSATAGASPDVPFGGLGSAPPPPAPNPSPWGMGAQSGSGMFGMQPLGQQKQQLYSINPVGGP